MVHHKITLFELEKILSRAYGLRAVSVSSEWRPGERGIPTLEFRGDTYDYPTFCARCGETLKWSEMISVGFDENTGKAKFYQWLKCPNGTTKWWEFGHDHPYKNYQSRYRKIIEGE